jgi:RHS repeat-associated protein
LGKRIVERVRTTYFDDASATVAPAAARPLGKHGPRGLKYQDYKLALTRTLLGDVFQRPGPGGSTVDLLSIALDPGGTAVRRMLDDPGVSGYVSGTAIDPTVVAGEPRPDEQYWIASGVAGFRRNTAPRFFLPERYTDSFGNQTKIAYDARGLFVQSSTDALGNRAEVTGFDYRVLAPRETLDASGNYAALAFDLLGMPVASALMGKNRTESGDSVAGIDPDPPVRDIERFFTQPFAQTTPLAWLGAATARFVYHLGERTSPSGTVVGWGQRPAGAVHIMREQHVARLAGADPDIQIAVAYSDGAGAAIVKKAQAEPDPDSTAARPPLRWIASGKTVFNNKGKPVKQYEPYFSTTGHRFGPTEVTQEVGVTPVMYYDGPGRLVRTELPDGSFSRVVFSPWHVESFDPNDTVLASAWYQARTPVNPAGAAPTAPDKRAAWLAARCNNTPAVTVLDTLGREVIAVAHNRVQDPAGTLTFDGRMWKDERYITFTKLDVEGKPLWIRDALRHLVMQYLTPPKPATAADDSVPTGSVPGYDIAGNLIFQNSMDAGDRWMLADAAGKPMLAWDFNEATTAVGATSERRLYFTAYDGLHRPIALWLRRETDPRVQVERFEYQDARPNDTNNLNGQALRHYDPSGLVETLKRDFKGNVESARRTLAAAGRASVVDWRTLRNPNGSLKLTNEPFMQFTEYDALSRISLHYNWHRVATRVAAYRPKYGERGVVTSENLLIGATRTPNGPTGGVNAGGPDAIQEIRYNVKGQKELVRLGNGTTTTYEYDLTTFRLTRILTRRRRSAGDTCSSAFNSASVIQDLQYTYDPVGNITQIVDAAQATRYGANQRIDPINRYEYDALYRLTSATGKENGATSGAPTHVEGKTPEAACAAPDPAALRNYTQRYSYDPVGNIKRMRHVAGPIGSWTRDYSYAYEVTGAPPSNRLATTTNGSGVVTTYRHDTHGNMLNLANAPAQFDLQWDHRDMIRQIDLGGGIAYYQYDAGKQRTRKRIENQNGLGGYWERIYLGGYELYRRYNGAGTNPIEEIETHHLFESGQRVLIVDDVITASDMAHPRPDGLAVRRQTLFRYQYTNHLGSACLETDNVASVISYEEYHPYGTSAYRAIKSGVEAPTRRYRYTGMERDDESGLSYHSARYYTPWLGRWASYDSSSAAIGLNRYLANYDSPIVHADFNGQAPPLASFGVPTPQPPFTPALPSIDPASGTGAVAPGAQWTAVEGVKTPAISQDVATGPQLPVKADVAASEASATAASRQTKIGNRWPGIILPLLVVGQFFKDLPSLVEQQKHYNEYLDRTLPGPEGSRIPKFLPGVPKGPMSFPSPEAAYAVVNDPEPQEDISLPGAGNSDDVAQFGRPSAERKQEHQDFGYYWDPFTNTIKFVKERMAVDHIYPEAKIRELIAVLGEGKLTDRQIFEILNFPDNFQPLPTSLNSSKRDRTAEEWQKALGQSFDPEYIRDAKALENQIGMRLVAKIMEFKALNEGKAKEEAYWKKVPARYR